MSFKHCELVRSLRPPRRRGFAADLATGFYLYAHFPMTYVAVGAAPDRMGWRRHFFVSGDGTLIFISLPATAQLYIWPVGDSPTRADSIARATDIWGRIPPMSMNALSSVELGRLHRVWERMRNRPQNSANNPASF